MALHPCPRCDRHVRHTEALCPFCQSPLQTRVDDDTPVARVSRAAMWLGATLALGACERSTETLTTTVTPTSAPPSSTAVHSATSAPQVLPTTVETNPTTRPPTGLFPQPQLAPQPVDPQNELLQQPSASRPPQPVTQRPPARPPQGPNDPGSFAARYGAPFGR
jgi:hypothetical protein